MAIGEWKIDRRITLAFIVMLVMQIAAVLIWATELAARVGVMEHTYSGIGNLNERFIRLEERLDHVKHDTEMIRQRLDTINDRPLKK